jgi:uncharacterized Fe-S cluster protein YjdI
VEKKYSPQTEPRLRDGVERVYRNDRIAVYWDPTRCIHVGFCFRGLPGVFKPQVRPWIDVDQADPEQIAEVVMRCPTGALNFERLDGGPQEPVTEETTISAEPNGPLYLRGRLRIIQEDGSERVETRAALCRCGLSANKPYCDGTHLRARFRSDR